MGPCCILKALTAQLPDRTTAMSCRHAAGPATPPGLEGSLWGELCPAQTLGCVRLLGARCWLTSWHSGPLGLVLSSLSWEDVESAILGKNAVHLDLGPLSLPLSGSGKRYGA